MHKVDPLTYPDWNECVLTSKHASVFHTANWLRVLHESYGHRPYYFASFRGGRLVDLLPFVEAKSWITGTRGVCLPFSDYCEPLIDETSAYSQILHSIIVAGRERRWKYFEIRGGGAPQPGVLPSSDYYRHVLVLRKDEQELLSKIRNNYRAKIRKAEAGDLNVSICRSAGAMAEYYRLHCLTRKRQGLPPQPPQFFQKLQQHVIAPNLGFVILVSYQGINVAGAVFLCFGRGALYKFGASDIRYQQLHPNYLLFWKAIQWLCQQGYEQLSFGRTEVGHKGLIQFKDGWGSTKTPLNYYRYYFESESFVKAHKLAKSHTHLRNSAAFVAERMPLPVLRLIGTVLYPHLE